MKRTLTTLGVCTAVLCSLALAATGQGPIAKLTRMFGSDEKQQNKLVTQELKINEASLALFKNKVPGSDKAGMKKQKGSLQTKTMDMWNMEGGTIIPTNATYDGSTNTLTASDVSKTSYNVFVTMTNGNYYAWYANGREYTFSATVETGGEAVVTPYIMFLDTDKKQLYIINNGEEISLNKDNNYTSDFTVTGSNSTGKPLYVGYIVQTANAGVSFKSTNNQLSYPYETYVAEKWSQEKNLPGLGITEEMADSAYTIVCDDNVTTLGLCLNRYGGYLSVTGMNTTATSVKVPYSVTIDDKEYGIRGFGNPYNDKFDWTGSQSVTSLNLEMMDAVCFDMEGSKITDLYVSDPKIYNSNVVGDIYLHIPYNFSRSKYDGMGFKRVLIGDEQPSYPESGIDNAWVMPGKNEGEYFGVINNSGELDVVEIFTQAESVTLPEKSKYYQNEYFITQFGESGFSTEKLLANAPNLKSVTIPENYNKLFVYWPSTQINELHIMGAKPQTEYGLPSNMTVYIAKEEAYSDFKYDELWDSAQLKPEGWELKKFESTSDDGLTTFEYDFFGGQLAVVNITSTAETVTIPATVNLNGKEYKVEVFGNERTRKFDWTNAQSVRTLDLSHISKLYLNLDGSAVTDIYVGENALWEDYSDLSGKYLHVPYGVNRYEYMQYGAKKVLIGEEQSYYPESNIENAWVIAGEEEGDYFSIIKSGDRYMVGEIFTDKESIKLPETTPYNNGTREKITVAGNADNYSYDSEILLDNAKNLKSLTVPAGYEYLHINWNVDKYHLNELHMMGQKPQTNWAVPDTYKVYVGMKEAYEDYMADSNWKNAELIPEGWEFEWLAVNVKRKGEFAQTYIEMTDADWSKGIYVKVTGALNETDLKNIKKLTNLRCLDLADATFDALPTSFLSNSPVKEITLPESLNAISSDAFKNCRSLQKVIAGGVKIIGSSAFYNCEKLTDFDLSGVTNIQDNAFCGCKSFAPSVLCESLNYIGNNAFSGTAVTEVAIPDGVTVLARYVFSGCKQLQKVTLPETLTAINSYAFRNCTSLSEITIPESVTVINDNVFRGCQALTEITIPSGVETVGYDMFAECSNITTVKCKAIVPPGTSGSFTSGMDLNHCTLYVAPFTIDAYRAAANWSDFYIMKPLNEPVKNIYVNRPMTFDLQSEDNAVLQDNPNMKLAYKKSDDYSNQNTVGELTAAGDGTLSAGVFTINHSIKRRENSSIYQSGDTYYSTDRRPTLVNNAENMRADSVVCSVGIEKNVWHFISFQYDVQMKDIFGKNNTDFVIRQYNSAKRAAAAEETTGKNNAPMHSMGGEDGTITETTESNWEPVPADGVLLAGKGYIIQAVNNGSDEKGKTYSATVVFPSRNTVTKNRLFTSSDIIVPLEEYASEFAHNRSWNLVGNPYPCYFNMHALKDGFYSPIILWKGSNYQAYSPVDDDVILRPNEAFFVQRPIDMEQMVFGAEGRMHYSAALGESYSNNKKPGVNYAPALNANGTERNVFNFTLEGCGSENRTRIVMNEKATMDYDNGRDAAKFFASTPMGAEIYVDGGVKYDICERPFADGTAQLGIRTAEAGRYTITLSGRYAEGWTVVLTDKLTGNTVNLNEGAYQFEAAEGTTAGRFMISFKSAATGIGTIDADIDADAEVSVVNAAGITVFNGRYAEFKAKAAAGIYVVVCGDKTYKTVVK